MTGKDALAIVSRCFERQDGSHEILLRYERGSGPASVTSAQAYAEGKRVAVRGGRIIQDSRR